ncbi:MAG: cupin domain-containing protein [Actinomycetota bacterium]|jgi:quercetin dioxygenase-like cupin family protein|nr:cupin domain-containing protein [Actinomycetota bacterium]
MSPHPHTIDDGAGERITFVGIRRDERGEYLEVRNSVAPGAGPPMHVHHLQEEGLTVERGTMGFRNLGEEERGAQRGESAIFAPGVGHRFWNAGDEELVCNGYPQPPNNLEYFLTELYASTQRNGGKRPGLFDGAYLSTRYRSEFAMLEIPRPVRRLLFPLIVAAGRALGRHRRFADAPEPVRRSRPGDGV